MAGHVASRVPGTVRAGGVLLIKMARQMPATKDLQVPKQAALSRQLVRRTVARWRLLAPTLFLLVMVNQLDKTNIVVVIADRRFLEELGLVGQHARIGLLSTLFFLGYGVGLLAWGLVVDRLGPRHSAAIGVCGWALCTGWCAFVRGIHELYAARLVLGVAEGCILPVCNTYVGRWFPVGEHNRIQSLWVNGNQVGIALGLPIVSALISVAGWRSVFSVLSAASLLLLEPMLLFLAPDDPELSRHANHEERQYIRGHRAVTIRPRADAPTHWTSLVTNRNLWILAACHTGTVATLFGLTAWIPTHLIQARGLAFDALKGWVAASYLLPIAVGLALGFVADRTMRPAALAAASSGVVAALVLMSVVVHNTVLAVLLLVTTLAAPMIYAAVNVSIVHSVVPVEQIGRATGLFIGLGNLIGGLAPTIIGYLISHFGGRYLAAFAFVSAVDLALIALYLAIDRIFANQACSTQVQLA